MNFLEDLFFKLIEHGYSYRIKEKLLIDKECFKNNIQASDDKKLQTGKVGIYKTVPKITLTEMEH